MDELPAIQPIRTPPVSLPKHPEADRFLRAVQGIAVNSAGLLEDFLECQYDAKGERPQFYLQGALLRFENNLGLYLKNFRTRLDPIWPQEILVLRPDQLESRLANTARIMGMSWIAGFALARDNPAYLAMNQPGVDSLIRHEEEAARACIAIVHADFEEGLERSVSKQRLAIKYLLRQVPVTPHYALLAAARIAAHEGAEGRLEAIAAGHEMDKRVLAGREVYLAQGHQEAIAEMIHHEQHVVRRALDILSANAKYSTQLIKNGGKSLSGFGWDGVLLYLSDNMISLKHRIMADDDYDEEVLNGFVHFSRQHALVNVLKHLDRKQGREDNGSLLRTIENLLAVSYTMLRGTVIPPLTYALQLHEEIHPGLRAWYMGEAQNVEMTLSILPDPLKALEEKSN